MKEYAVPLAILVSAWIITRAIEIGLKLIGDRIDNHSRIVDEIRKNTIPRLSDDDRENA